MYFQSQGQNSCFGSFFQFQFAPQERVPESIIEQTVDLPVSQILEEPRRTGEVDECMADRRAIVDVPIPQIVETIAEAVEVFLLKCLLTPVFRAC